MKNKVYLPLSIEYTPQFIKKYHCIVWVMTLFTYPHGSKIDYRRQYILPGWIIKFVVIVIVVAEVHMV